MSKFITIVESKRQLVCYLSIVLAIVLIASFTRDLNPFLTEIMFIGHDNTVAARFSEYFQSLISGQFPPRVALNMSYGLGYPVFNFYAPFTHLVSLPFQFLFFNSIITTKVMFLLAYIIAAISSFLYFNHFFQRLPSLFGSILYVTMPYVALGIFVRINIGETWFIALFPLALYMIERNNKSYTPTQLLFTVLTLSALFTTHNVLSLISVVLISIYTFIIYQSIRGFLPVILGLITSAYFIIPAVMELGLTNAQIVATETTYANHFVCISQFFKSEWNYGASTVGCEFDGISFFLGYVHVIFFSIGCVIFVYQLIKHRTIKSSQLRFVFFLCLGLGSLFFTTKYSEFFWIIGEPLFKLFQFPWRFLALTVLPFAFFSSFSISKIDSSWQLIIVPILIVIVFFLHSNFFKGNIINSHEFTNTYVSEDYISNQMAYEIPEYLPIRADYNYWKNLQNDKDLNGLMFANEKSQTREIAFVKDGEYKVNVHYFPNWSIKLDDTVVIPEVFDDLGRPILSKEEGNVITVSYKQTFWQHVGNTISMITLISLSAYTFFYYRKNGVQSAIGA